MLENKLGIILITYNRAHFLQKTLTYLAQTPFLHCSITVIDNCSTDETPKVCAQTLGEGIFRQFKVVRNPYNIGGNANILKALQAAEYPYTWVVCDDDYISPTGWEDVIDEIEKEEVSSIILQAAINEHQNQRYYQSLKGEHFNSQQMMLGKDGYVWALSFLPNSINRLDFIRKHIAEAAMFCGHSFPHLAMHIFAEPDTKYYCAKNSLICGNALPTFGFFYYPLDLYFLRICQFIENRRIRHNVISHEWTLYGFNSPLKIWFGTLLFLGIKNKYSLSKRIKYFVELFIFSNWIGRFCLVFLFPLVFVPSKLAPIIYQLLMRKPKVIQIEEESLQRGRI